MPQLLTERPAWYVAGLLMGLVVLGVLATLNRRMGLIGGYTEIVERAAGRGRFGWKSMFVVGVLGGGFVFAALTGSLGGGNGEYGWLGRSLSGGWELLIAPVLLVAGVMIGYGAKLAGGCTAGNGIGGTSQGSPAAFVATITFVSTAVVSTLIVDGLF